MDNEDFEDLFVEAQLLEDSSQESLTTATANLDFCDAEDRVEASRAGVDIQDATESTPDNYRQTVGKESCTSCSNATERPGVSQSSPTTINDRKHVAHHVPLLSPQY